MFDPLSNMPDYWKTDVTRITRGGRDSSGNWIEGEEVVVRGCVVSPGTRREDGEFSDITTTEARLYAPVDDSDYEPSSGAHWTSGDTVLVPEGATLPGRWHVTGRPVRWPTAWEVALTGEGGAA